MTAEFTPPITTSDMAKVESLRRFAIDSAAGAMSAVAAMFPAPIKDIEKAKAKTRRGMRHIFSPQKRSPICVRWSKIPVSWQSLINNVAEKNIRKRSHGKKFKKIGKVTKV